jgi:hypothetical protein
MWPKETTDGKSNLEKSDSETLKITSLSFFFSLFLIKQSGKQAVNQKEKVTRRATYEEPTH